ncbi:MAG: glycosyltransferase family 2 protein [Candidatus Brocadiaceae bacterium]|nr:glycosyltransferase family 2 protein [Candidatus Brocadiaceae bacterium]
MHSDTLITIPAYNEERTILKVVALTKKLYPDIDIVVINDGSIDGTTEMAEKAGAIVLSHPFNMGYGVTLQTGYKYAIRNNYTYLVQMDGDGQHDPESVKTMLPLIKGGSFDVVLGCRFSDTSVYKMSIFRSIGMKVFRFFLYVLSGQKISDITSGFQAMNKRVLSLFVSDVFPSDYPDADVILLLSKNGFKIGEVPVAMYPNLYGKSMHSNPLNVVYYVFKMFLSMLITKIRT